jgi:hypothetical protein
MRCNNYQEDLRVFCARNGITLKERKNGLQATISDNFIFTRHWSGGGDDELWYRKLIDDLKQYFLRGKRLHETNKIKDYEQ